MTGTPDPFDHKMKLADFAYRSFNDRRSYEWKFLIAVWGAFLLLANKDWGLPVSSLLFGLPPWASAGLLTLVVYQTWIKGCWTANQNDKSRYDKFFRQAIEQSNSNDTKEIPTLLGTIEKLLKNKIRLLERRKSNTSFICLPLLRFIRPLFNWSNLLQVIITCLVFYYAAEIVHTRKADSSEKSNLSITVNWNSATPTEKTETGWVTFLVYTGGFIAFLWTVIQFILVRKRESNNHNYQAYHTLIKTLVEPESEGKGVYADRQCAALFELRSFPRYDEVTLRTLSGLERKWSQILFPNQQISPEPVDRLLYELNQTKEIIENRRANPTNSQWWKDLWD